MIAPARFFEALKAEGFEFFTGVPDSLLKDLCGFIATHVPADRHVINANEGSAVALAAGYHLATGRVPVVYLQNSGTGNIVNPLLSLTDPEVYGIPILFLIGWRGEPGINDEPQHVTQGRVMPELLTALGLSFDVVDGSTGDVGGLLRHARERMVREGRSHALLVRRGTFEAYSAPAQAAGPAPALSRERAIAIVLSHVLPDDVLVATTGMISREVFELRERCGQPHERDFLSVGSMGHCSQIALGIAAQQPGRQVYCFDGDGAVIMHMGSLAIVGSQRPRNLKHVVFNNAAHDSVGGQPTAADRIDFCTIARACGYARAVRAATEEDVIGAAAALREAAGPAMLEVIVRLGARADLGRPTLTPRASKDAFMKALRDGQP